MKPGSVLPNGDRLAARFGVHRDVALRACQVLVSAGFLNRRGYKLLVAAEEQSNPLIHQSISVISYFADFGPAAARILDQHRVGHRLIGVSFARNPRLASVLEKAFSERPAGMILQSVRLDEDAKSVLKRIDIPTVLCTDAETSELNHSTIRLDLNRGIEKALRHLADLGHRQLAIVVGFDDTYYSECYRAVCLKSDLRASAARIWRAKAETEAAMQEALVEGCRKDPRVTGVLCDSHLAAWAFKAFPVPGRLSLIGFGDGPQESKLTTVSLRDFGCFALWACTELISRLQVLASGRPAKPPTHTLFVPELLVQESTQALATKKARTNRLTASPPQRDAPEETWRKVYPLLKGIPSSGWFQLDLSQQANHSMTRQHGWLGAEPLNHFPPGLRSIHGVPFRVLDEARNGGRAVITFRSPQSHSAGGSQLPTTAEVKVNSLVRALYFLHGCGYAKRGPFAQYRMHYRGGDSIAVPLVPLGSFQDAAERRKGRFLPNLQDWWPLFPQRNFPHAHQVTVFNPADPGSYERMLYSLEWINPHPGEEISVIEVRVDPAAGPTLALIAITALL